MPTINQQRAKAVRQEFPMLYDAYAAAITTLNGDPECRAVIAQTLNASADYRLARTFRNGLEREHPAIDEWVDAAEQASRDDEPWDDGRA